MTRRKAEVSAMKFANLVLQNFAKHRTRGLLCVYRMKLGLSYVSYQLITLFPKSGIDGFWVFRNRIVGRWLHMAYVRLGSMNPQPPAVSALTQATTQSSESEDERSFFMGMSNLAALGRPDMC